MKRFIVVLPCILLLLVSCQDKEAQAELNELKALTELEEQNKALVKKYIEAWNSLEIQVLEEYLDPGFKVYIPSNSGEPMSLEQFKGWMEVIFQGFPDSHYDIQDIFCEGDLVCIRWTYTATQQGDYMGVPATGKKVVGSAIEIFRVENGKIVEERSEMDAMGMMLQLGFVLSPGS